MAWVRLSGAYIGRLKMVLAEHKRGTSALLIFRTGGGRDWSDTVNHKIMVETSVQHHSHLSHVKDLLYNIFVGTTFELGYAKK